MDYDDLLHIKVRYGFLLLCMVALFIGIGIYVLNLKVRDVLPLKGIYNDGLIYVEVPIDYSDTIKNGEYVKIDNEEYIYEIKAIGAMEVDASTFLNYQVFSISLDEEFLNNEVIDITFCFNEEKIFEKLKKKI